MRTINLVINPGTRLWRELSSRGDNWNSIICRDLLRYYAILNDASPKFSVEELNLLRNVLRNVSLNEITSRSQFVERILQIVDGDHLDKTYGVNRNDLMKHLDDMPLSDLMAFLDQEERSSRRHRTS